MLRILLQSVKWILIALAGIVLYSINVLVLITFVILLVWRGNNKRKKQYENSLKLNTQFLKEHAEDFEVMEVTEMNADGKNRQEIMTRCYRGDTVTLEFKPTEESPYYVEVWTKFGVIGTLAPYDVAKHIGFFRTTDNLTGEIKKLTGGTIDKPEHGCIISVYLIISEQAESKETHPQLNTEML
jgi:hypothetical protein